MTSEKMNTFTSELVQMAMAVERLPQIEAQLADANNVISTQSDIIKDREDWIANRNARVKELEDKLVEVTKERDDASFRVLEAEDKASRVLDLARTLATGLGQVIAELEPPMPELVPENMTWGPSAADPTVQPQTNASDGGNTSEQSSAISSVTTDATSHEGQSEPGPTSGDIVNEEANQSKSIDTTPPDKPYAGKFYSDVNLEGKYPGRDEWFAGGGNDAGWWN